MFRTIIVRSDVVKGTLRKAARLNFVRSISAECAKRRPQIREKSLLTTNLRCSQWNHQILRHYAKEYPAHNRVLLPALSPTMEMGTIVSWDKKEGDKLNEGDLLAEIETDKATMGFETPEEGYLAKILIAAGTKEVPIGKLVCIIVENKEDVEAFKDYVDEGAAAAPPKPAAAPSAPSATPPAAAPPSPPAAAQSIGAMASGGAGERVYASPMARRLAEQRNIRLQGKGSGMYDSITSQDLASMGAAPAAGGAPMPPPMPSPGATYVDIPLTGMRTTIAKRLSQSKQTIPEYFVSADVNVDKVLALRAKINKKMEKQGVRVSVNDFVIKAAAMASRAFPEVNSFWMETFIRQQSNVDVSVAVSTPTGLITPIVFEANAKGVVQISKEVKQLAEKARTGKLQPQEFMGGSLSVSNLGMFGVTTFTAIINPPQAAILAVGTTQQRLVLDETAEKGFRVANFMNVSLTSDHRIVDGALAAQWISKFRDNMEDPVNMIL